MGWNYRGANVQVPRTADIPPQFWPNGRLSAIVQEVLNTVEPWQDGDDPIETETFQDELFLPIVVPLQGRKPWWGIHAGHHARQPQASPFIQVDFDLIAKTNRFTIELMQSAQRPKLVRAYPGDYIPPLPWMGSAAHADGGRQACLNFWRRHAYVYRRQAMLRRRPEPAWFNH